jgi:hypothetical protein
VPTKFGVAVEGVVDFVRNDIAIGVIGPGGELAPRDSADNILNPHIARTVEAGDIASANIKAVEAMELIVSLDCPSINVIDMSDVRVRRHTGTQGIIGFDGSWHLGLTNDAQATEHEQAADKQKRKTARPLICMMARPHKVCPFARPSEASGFGPGMKPFVLLSEEGLWHEHFLDHPGSN